MKVVLIYLLGGAIANYGSIFVVWGLFSKICGDNTEMYFRIMNNNKKHGVIFFERFEGLFRILMVFLLWPINVLNTFLIGIPAIREAKEESHPKHTI